MDVAEDVTGGLARDPEPLGATARHDVEGIPPVLALIAQRAVPSAMAVSVTLLHNGHPYTAGASDGIAGALDEVQYESGGPCATAAREGGQVHVVIEDEAWRWPEFAASAATAGVRSSLAVALRADEGIVGSLNLYSAAPALFGAEERGLAELLAVHCAMAIAHAAALSDAQRMAAQLREALETRDLIGQAKGILMERESCTPEEAFDMLRRASQRTNRKLRDVAGDLTNSRVRRARHPHQ